MKIGILLTGHPPDQLSDKYGDYAKMFARLLDGNGFEFVAYDLENLQFPNAITECDGWLITGSKHGAYDTLPWIPPLEDMIRDIYAAGFPIVGICFGHQIFAQALGGKVEKFSGGWAVGHQTYDWDGRSVDLFAWHQDQVIVPPDNARSVASNALCKHAALVYGDTAFTVQAHPEYDAGFIDGLATYRGPGVVPDDLLSAARASLVKPVDNAHIARQIARFFKERTLS